MRAYFLRLYLYNHWANQKYLTIFKELPEIPERIALLFSHVLVAQKLWLSRIKGSPDLSLHIWKIQPLSELEALIDENTSQWCKYLSEADEADFSRLLSYENFQKVAYTNLVSDIIIHTANHASYHRAQFALLLRQTGVATPPNTDFITFVREYQGEFDHFLPGGQSLGDFSYQNN